ncbi:MAG: helix-turn-helix domain-containing protein [Methyloceanibacter sp.]
MNSVQTVGDRWAEAGFRQRYGSSMPQVRQAIDLSVAAVFGVDLHDLRSTKRGSPQVAFARQVAMYLAHVVARLSLTDVGILFTRDRTTVAHACCVIEDQRDDPEFDSRLEHLEHAIVSLIHALSLGRDCL